MAVKNFLLYYGIYGEDDIVLDFFSGSSTTAHAVLLYNNKENISNNFIIKYNQILLKIKIILKIFLVYRMRDSNPQPRRYKLPALTIAPIRHIHIKM